MSESAKLPVIQSEVCGCDRRDVLQGVAVGALAVGIAACRIDDPYDQPTDAATDGPAGTGVSMCGANVCVDLTHPANTNLTNVGGAKVVVSGTKKILVIRSTTTDFITMTAVCTHAGITVGYRMAQNDIRCPGHGSIFMLDGTVVTGPATRPLAVFTNTFDMAGNVLTIMV